MITVIGVRFKKVGKVYYFDPGDQLYHIGDGVIVETARGIELGYVAMENKEVGEDKVVLPLKPVIRIASEEDYECEQKNEQLAKAAFKTCEEAIASHKLEMKLVDVEYTFDGSKILFYFTAEGRVDFRDLVKSLASIFRTRIELRQIGVRDEAKMLGGLGICGQPFCCSRFLGEFQPVSIKMAKEQGLSLNPTKISGTCGRLMCCLKYEQEAYEDLLKATPKVGTVVDTPDGEGVVASVGLLRGKLGVRLNTATDAPPTEYNLSELTVLQDPKKGGKQEHSDKGSKAASGVDYSKGEKRSAQNSNSENEPLPTMTEVTPKKAGELRGTEANRSSKKSREKIVREDTTSSKESTSEAKTIEGYKQTDRSANRHSSDRRSSRRRRESARSSQHDTTKSGAKKGPQTGSNKATHTDIDDKKAFELLQKLKQK